ncbi:MAG: NAD-dependent epimerase/dehydratase family protein, partial [Candidatus Eiseniibacteriota bacterium]
MAGLVTSWRGRRVLVSGASGFVGHYLVPVLERLGAEVHGLGFETRMPDLPLAGWHVAELRDGASLNRAMAAAKPDAIDHL